MSEIPSAIDVLRRVEVLRGLGEAALAGLAAATTERAVAVDEAIVQQGEHGEAVFVVARGRVTVSINDNAGTTRDVANLGPGELFGEIQLIVGGVRSATVRAAEPTVLLQLDRRGLDQAAELAPELMTRLTTLVRRRLLDSLLATTLPVALGPIDGTILTRLVGRVEWVTLRAGEALFQQGDPGDAWYVVTSGRLRVLQADARGHEHVMGELGRGESIGEIALLADLPRTATPYAVRDTILLRLSAEAFHALLAESPTALHTIVRTVIRRSTSDSQKRRTQTSCETITVVPLGDAVDTAAFTTRLVESLGRLGRTLALSPANLDALGVMSTVPPEGHPSWLRFSAWLDERAGEHRFIVLVCDPREPSWTRRAVREADHVLLVANAGTDPLPGPREKELFAHAGHIRARRTLVLLHPPETRLPRGTAPWLDARHVDGHQHVRTDRPTDIDRVARTLAGRAVALVLGAGGARGFAHVGTIRALLDAGIPIDHIGGTSSGAMISGMYGMGLGPDAMMALNRRMVALKPFGDFTFPITALLRGRRVERAAEMAFGDTMIEDLWIPYFCTSCDISAFEEVVHTRGRLSTIALASTALPGVLPPRVLDRHMHVDGGSTETLPGRIMRQRCQGVLIAVDVSTERVVEVSQAHYPGGWTAFWRRLWKKDPRPLPTIAELFMRAVSVGTVNATEALAHDADLFLKPPVEEFGTVQVEMMDAIERIGYEYARDRLAVWKRPV